MTPKERELVIYIRRQAVSAVKMGDNVAAVMIGALTEGVYVRVETNHYATLEAPASIRIVDSVDAATHVVASSYYNADTDKTVFDFERIKKPGNISMSGEWVSGDG